MMRDPRSRGKTSPTRQYTEALVEKDIAGSNQSAVSARTTAASLVQCSKEALRIPLDTGTRSLQAYINVIGGTHGIDLDISTLMTFGSC